LAIGRTKTFNLDFDTKRLALDALDITVWLDGQNVEVTGIIEPEIFWLQNMREYAHVDIGMNASVVLVV